MPSINPLELYGLITGLKQARLIAERYKGVDMKNYIGELDERIDAAENVKGYREYITKREGTSK